MDRLTEEIRNEIGALALAKYANDTADAALDSDDNVDRAIALLIAQSKAIWATCSIGGEVIYAIADKSELASLARSLSGKDMPEMPPEYQDLPFLVVLVTDLIGSSWDLTTDQ